MQPLDSATITTMRESKELSIDLKGSVIDCNKSGKSLGAISMQFKGPKINCTKKQLSASVKCKAYLLITTYKNHSVMCAYRPYYCVMQACCIFLSTQRQQCVQSISFSSRPYLLCVLVPVG